MGREREQEQEQEQEHEYRVWNAARREGGVGST